jgi:hypothetical protein
MSTEFKVRRRFCTRSFCLKLVLVAVVAASSASCLESSFELSPDSRLPKWFEVPEGATKSDLRVTLDYYSTFDGAEAVLKLYKKDRFFALKEVTAIPRKPYAKDQRNPPAGFPKGYPKYVVITVDGITDIIEHRKMEPIFFVTDDPAAWAELIGNIKGRE